MLEKKWAEPVVLGTTRSLFQDQISLSKDGSARTPTLMSHPSQEPTLRLPQGSREGASARQGVFVTYHALRLTPEYLWFLFISSEEIRKKETSEALSCLPEFKERQHFRGTVSLRNSRRRAEE